MSQTQCRHSSCWAATGQNMYMFAMALHLYTVSQIEIHYIVYTETLDKMLLNATYMYMYTTSSGQYK